MSGVALDVRVRRTQERLRAAVLQLASTQPVEEIQVAELVRIARINRTTFYKHAAAPAQVLSEVLYADLDRLRAEILAGDATPAQRWARSAAGLADHLERFDGVYTTGLVGRRSAVLHRLVVDHFAATGRAVIGQRLPEGAGSREWRTKAYSEYVAHGQAGIVEAWLSEPRPRDRTLLISASGAMLPPWLTGGP